MVLLKSWEGENGNSKALCFTSKQNKKGRLKPEEQKDALENIKMLYNAWQETYQII